ncbi:MAG: hypothetical protein PHC93_04565 [Candidatus Omnitrophica bacterium]|nr:hypothetical protein [Candidatus Omnitrophota bacterium]
MKILVIFKKDSTAKTFIGIPDEKIDSYKEHFSKFEYEICSIEEAKEKYGMPDVQPRNIKEEIAKLPPIEIPKVNPVLYENDGPSAREKRRKHQKNKFSQQVLKSLNKPKK